MRKIDSMNVIPFIDIMLVLLAIVLMTASFVQHGQITVSVPESKASEQSSTAPTIENVITIDAEGKYYLDDQMIALEALQNRLAAMDSLAHLVLQVDANTPFQAFVSMTDLLREHQLENIRVITKSITTPQ